LATKTVFKDAPEEDPDITIATNAKYPGVTAYIGELTVPFCTDWLARMGKNRALKKRRAAGLTRDMEEGYWVLDGASMRETADGQPFDGRHRAKSYLEYAARCAAAGKDPQPLATVIVRGLPEEARRVTDSGTSRSPGDAMAIMLDLARPYDCASVAKQVHVWRNTLEGMAGLSSTVVTPTEVETILLNPVYEMIPEYVDWTAAMWKDYHKSVPRLTPLVAGFGRWLFSWSDEVTGREFMKSVWDGTGQATTDAPALVFRNRMISASNSRENIQPIDTLCFLIMAWNAFQEGHGLNKLQRPRGKNGPGTGHFTAATIPAVHHGPPRPVRVGGKLRLPDAVDDDAEVLVTV
jgi:hypothetical protein